MPEQTAYQLAAQLFDELGIPSFPVLVERDEEKGKWQKKPIAKWGAVTHTTAPDEFNWRRANAVGVPMGSRSGLFAFDIDSYKPKTKAAQWVNEQGLPATRTHRTASGGTHLIYRMPAGMWLGNSAPKVHGLDVRGDGGYIVWADTLGLYEVVDDRAPVAMPQKVVDLLVKLNEGMGRIVHDADVPKPRWIDDDELMVKLGPVLSDPLSHRDLVNRFLGSKAGLKDGSRSAMDMSMASLLARAGFTYDEIVMVLLRHFDHGKAERDGWTDAVEREVCRCAYKATQRIEEAREARLGQLMQGTAAKTAELAKHLLARGKEQAHG